MTRQGPRSTRRAFPSPCVLDQTSRTPDSLLASYLSPFVSAAAPADRGMTQDDDHDDDGPKSTLCAALSSHMASESFDCRASAF